MDRRLSQSTFDHFAKMIPTKSQVNLTSATLIFRHATFLFKKKSREKFILLRRNSLMGRILMGSSLSQRNLLEAIILRI